MEGEREKMLPCRWCDTGASTNIPHLHELPPDNGPRKWQVMCLGCCASGPIGFTPADACRFWNRRPAPVPPAGEGVREALMRLIDKAATTPGIEHDSELRVAIEKGRAALSSVDGERE